MAPESFGLPAVPTRVRDYIFKKKKLGLIDLHDRDYDEPAGNGGFLFNGGRLYLDMGHVEYCTPECLSLADVVAYDQVRRSAAPAGAAGAAPAARRFVHQEQHRPLHQRHLGCHENYLLNRDAPLTKRNIDTLLTFLAVRILLVGAGRVGITQAPRRYGKMDAGEFVPYQISQRARLHPDRHLRMGAVQPRAHQRPRRAAGRLPPVPPVAPAPRRLQPVALCKRAEDRHHRADARPAGGRRAARHRALRAGLRHAEAFPPAARPVEGADGRQVGAVRARPCWRNSSTRPARGKDRPRCRRRVDRQRVALRPSTGCGRIPSRWSASSTG